MSKNHQKVRAHQNTISALSYRHISANHKDKTRNKYKDELAETS